MPAGRPHQQYLSDAFQGELRFLGIESSPAFVRAPEGNGCAERFIRTLKENLLWVMVFETVEELRLALLEFRETYNPTWPTQRHGFITPSAVRQTQLQPAPPLRHRLKPGASETAAGKVRWTHAEKRRRLQIGAPERLYQQNCRLRPGSHLLARDRAIRLRLDQSLVEHFDCVWLPGPVHGSEFASKTLQRKLEQIALAEAAPGAVAGRSQIANHLG